VVVAGEVVEDLSDPGLLLDNVRKHLNVGGKLTTTTPNAWTSHYFISVALHRRQFTNPTQRLEAPLLGLAYNVYRLKPWE